LQKNSSGKRNNLGQAERIDVANNWKTKNGRRAAKCGAKKKILKRLKKKTKQRRSAPGGSRLPSKRNRQGVAVKNPFEKLSVLSGEDDLFVLHVNSTMGQYSRGEREKKEVRRKKVANTMEVRC